MTEANNPQGELAAPERHPGGRPSLYDPSFCDRVLKWGAEGKSKAWMAAELDVTRQTLENWEAAHPEFLDAITRAVLKSQQWWEDKGQAGMMLQGFGASVWSRSMAARFPADWREKTVQEQTGPDGGAVKHEHVHKIERAIVNAKD